MKKILFIVILLTILFTLSCNSASDVNTSRTTWYDGIWYGTGYQSNNNDYWTIYIRIDALNNQYLINYPSLNCGGQWQIVEQGSDYIKFQEKLAFGQEFCVDNGYVVLTYKDENHLDFKCYFPDNSFAATSILIRSDPEF